MNASRATAVAVQTATPYEQALAAGWLPIREVARQTGVNAVTLRAWERRYGLVVPERTAKGHRLYTQAHVQRIHTILTWLARGVAVSQVKQLLDAPANTVEAQVESDWQPLRRTLLKAIGELAERQVDEIFNRVMALYPPSTLYEHLLQPLLAELEQRWQGQFGAQMERTFFFCWPATGTAPVAHRLADQQRRLPGGSLRLAAAQRRTGSGHRTPGRPRPAAVRRPRPQPKYPAAPVGRLPRRQTHRRTGGGDPPRRLCRNYP